MWVATPSPSPVAVTAAAGVQKDASSASLLEILRRGRLTVMDPASMCLQQSTLEWVVNSMQLSQQAQATLALLDSAAKAEDEFCTHRGPVLQSHGVALPVSGNVTARRMIPVKGDGKMNKVLFFTFSQICLPSPVLCHLLSIMTIVVHMEQLGNGLAHVYRSGQSVEFAKVEAMEILLCT